MDDNTIFFLSWFVLADLNCVTTIRDDLLSLVDVSQVGSLPAENRLSRGLACFGLHAWRNRGQGYRLRWAELDSGSAYIA